MKIYVVRHGQSRMNRYGELSGTMFTEDPLTPEGMAQVRQAALILPRTLSKIYASDLLRTRHTAEIINESLRIPISYHPELRERNFGSLSGTTWEQIGAEIGQDAFAIDRRQQYDYRPYGGESVEEVTSRITQFLHQLNEEGEDNFLMVTHAGIILLLYHLYRDEQPSIIENASVHEFTINKA